MRFYKTIAACMLALLSVGTYQARGAPAESSSDKQQYQLELIEEMKHLRPEQFHYQDYSGPWIETQFFDYFVANPELNKQLKRVYIPMCVSLALHHGMLHNVTAALKGLDRRYKYFIIVLMQRGLGLRHIYHPVDVPHDLDIVGFMAGGSTVSDSIRYSVPIPLLARELQPSSPPPEKEHNVMFQGSIWTHYIRVRFDQEYRHVYSILNMTRDLSWVDAIEKSNFTFSPRGKGETSFRMYHALQLGSIPIYVWQGQRWLPYEELIDWCDIAVVMSADQMKNGGLKQKIDSIQHKVPQMQENIAKVRHMFTYNFTIQYVVDTLKKRFNPEPNKLLE